MNTRYLLASAYEFIEIAIVLALLVCAAAIDWADKELRSD